MSRGAGTWHFGHGRIHLYFIKDAIILALYTNILTFDNTHQFASNLDVLDHMSYSKYVLHIVISGIPRHAFEKL